MSWFHKKLIRQIQLTHCNRIMKNNLLQLQVSSEDQGTLRGHKLRKNMKNQAKKKKNVKLVHSTWNRTTQILLLKEMKILIWIHSQKVIKSTRVLSLILKIILINIDKVLTVGTAQIVESTSYPNFIT